MIALITSMCPPGATWAAVQTARTRLRMAEDEWADAMLAPVHVAASGMAVSKQAKLKDAVAAVLACSYCSGLCRRLPSVHDGPQDVCYRTLPGCAAIARGIRKIGLAVSGTLRNVAGKKGRERAYIKHRETGISKPMVGGMINFGYSGGADVMGHGLLLDRWADIGVVMQDLEVDWFFGISCRCPPVADTAALDACFNYVRFGPESSEYGAVVLLVRKDRVGVVQYLPEYSASYPAHSVGPVDAVRPLVWAKYPATAYRAE